MRTLKELCEAIAAGYAAGKSMYESGMPTLAEELTSRTDEILALIDPCTSADAAAPLYEAGKTYRTRDGRQVYVTATNGTGRLCGTLYGGDSFDVAQPINGRYVGSDRVNRWCADGSNVKPGYEDDGDLLPGAVEDEEDETRHQAALESGSATLIPRPEDEPANPAHRAVYESTKQVLAKAPWPEPIPHADLIRAVLDGKGVQCRDIKFRGQPPTVPGFQYVECFDATSDYMGLPRTEQYLRQAMLDLLVNSAPDYEFRLKPEPIVNWIAIPPDGLVLGCAAAWRSEALSDYKGKARGVIRIEQDPDTLDVISARTEEP